MTKLKLPLILINPIRSSILAGILCVSTLSAAHAECEDPSGDFYSAKFGSLLLHIAHCETENARPLADGFFVCTRGGTIRLLSAVTCHPIAEWKLNPHYLRGKFHVGFLPSSKDQLLSLQRVEDAEPVFIPKQLLPLKWIDGSDAVMTSRHLETAAVSADGMKVTFNPEMPGYSVPTEVSLSLTLPTGTQHLATHRGLPVNLETSVIPLKTLSNRGGNAFGFLETYRMAGGDELSYDVKLRQYHLRRQLMALLNVSQRPHFRSFSYNTLDDPRSSSPTFARFTELQPFELQEIRYSAGPNPEVLPFPTGGKPVSPTHPQWGTQFRFSSSAPQLLAGKKVTTVFSRRSTLSPLEKAFEDHRVLFTPAVGGIEMDQGNSSIQ